MTQFKKRTKTIKIVPAWVEDSTVHRPKFGEGHYHRSNGGGAAVAVTITIVTFCLIWDRSWNWGTANNEATRIYRDPLDCWSRPNSKRSSLGRNASNWNWFQVGKSHQLHASLTCSASCVFFKNFIGSRCEWNSSIIVNFFCSKCSMI